MIESEEIEYAMLEIVWPEDLEPRRQLLHRERERMVGILRQMPAVKKVIAFGSSLTGDIHEGSDVDLIVVNGDGGAVHRPKLDAVEGTAA